MQHQRAERDGNERQGKRGGGRGFKQTGPPDAELAARAQAGDIDARNQLIMRHIGYLHMLVRKVLAQQRRCTDSEPLIAVAVQQFARAIMLYEPSRGKLITFAAMVIEQSVRQAIWADSPLTRPVNFPRPRSLRDAWFKASSSPVDIHEPAMKNSVGCSGEEAYARLELEEKRLLARWAMEQLDERSRAVIVMRNVEQLTLAEVGAVLGVSKERVRQIENQAIERMRVMVAA